MTGATGYQQSTISDIIQTQLKTRTFAANTSSSVRGLLVRAAGCLTACLLINTDVIANCSLVTGRTQLNQKECIKYRAKLLLQSLLTSICIHVPLGNPIIAVGNDWRWEGTIRVCAPLVCPFQELFSRQGRHGVS